MNAKDFAKLAMLGLAAYGAYTAWQAWDRNEDWQNGAKLAIAGVSLYTALHKF
jgi:hypothetical protein